MEEEEKVKFYEKRLNILRDLLDSTIGDSQNDFQRGFDAALKLVISDISEILAEGEKMVDK